MTLYHFCVTVGIYLVAVLLLSIPVFAVLYSVELKIVRREDGKWGMLIPLIVFGGSVMISIFLGFYSVISGMNLLVALLTMLLAIVVINIPNCFLIYTYKKHTRI